MSSLFNLKPLEPIKLCKQNPVQETETIENIRQLYPKFVDLLNIYKFSCELINGEDLLIKNTLACTTLIKKACIKTLVTNINLSALLSALSSSICDVILEFCDHTTKGKVNDISFSISNNFCLAKYCKISRFTLNNGKIKAHLKYFIESNYSDFRNLLLRGPSVKCVTISSACDDIGLSEKLIDNFKYSKNELIIGFTEIVNDYLVEKYSNIIQYSVDFIISILKNIAKSVAGVEQINIEIKEFQKKLDDFENKLDDFENSKENILYKELIAIQTSNEERRLKEQEEKKFKEEEEKRFKEEEETRLKDEAEKAELKVSLLNNAQKIVTTVAAKQHKLKVLEELTQQANIKKLEQLQVEVIKPCQVQPKILDKKTINEMMTNVIKTSAQKTVLLLLWECANKNDFDSEISKKQYVLPNDPEFNILLNNLLALDYGERINFLLEHEIYSS